MLYVSLGLAGARPAAYVGPHSLFQDLFFSSSRSPIGNSVPTGDPESVATDIRNLEQHSMDYHDQIPDRINLGLFQRSNCLPAYLSPPVSFPKHPSVGDQIR